MAEAREGDLAPPRTRRPAVFLLGFMAIGGNWFITYLNSKFNGLEPAFQNSVMTTFMLVLVSVVLIGSHLAHEKK